jgi:hypothetical protein
MTQAMTYVGYTPVIDTPFLLDVNFILHYVGQMHSNHLSPFRLCLMLRILINSACIRFKFS